MPFIFWETKTHDVFSVTPGFLLRTRIFLGSTEQIVLFFFFGTQMFPVAPDFRVLLGVCVVYFFLLTAYTFFCTHEKIALLGLRLLFFGKLKRTVCFGNTRFST